MNGEVDMMMMMMRKKTPIYSFTRNSFSLYCILWKGREREGGI
jgi:hypothetical protein